MRKLTAMIVGLAVFTLTCGATFECEAEKEECEVFCFADR